MVSRVVFVLSLCAAAVLGDLANNVDKIDTKVLLSRQKDLMELFYNIHEPLTGPKYGDIKKTWTIQDNLDQFKNRTAASQYVTMMKYQWVAPRNQPFSPYEPAHAADVYSLFHMLYSAKTYDTFYKTAVLLRDSVNPALFVYVINVVVFYRADTQGIMLPPIYEVLPTYFNYGEVINTALKIDSFGKDFAKTYPAVAGVNQNEVLIDGEQTFWPYADDVSSIKYYTNDYALNAAYYYLNVKLPYWSGKPVIPELGNMRRGELWLFAHKQILARYYMERLSAGLGEIPEITEVAPESFNTGLVHENGIPYASRPSNFPLGESKFAFELEKIKQYESRIWESIDKGYFIDREGHKVSLMTEESINTLGLLIEGNYDSPNSYYYKDFIRPWKLIIGNSIRNREYAHYYSPWAVPSALETFSTPLRDPAFYSIWKRVLRLVHQWQRRVKYYTPEQLSFPGVVIEKVETDTLTTYFDKTVMNISSYLSGDSNVLVSYPRLNHKPFSIRVTVKSEVAKKVLVKFFLAPKYDSKGFEIPILLNTQNFLELDQFVTDLKTGENTIVRKSTAFTMVGEDWTSAADVYNKVLKGEWTPEEDQSTQKLPQRLLLPKGHKEGMKFLLMAYVQEYTAPANPASRFLTDLPLGYPTNRPLLVYQIAPVRNMKIQDIVVYHKE